MTPPPIQGTPDPTRTARLDAERVTANWRAPSDRHPADLTWSPLFAGEAVAPGQKTVQRQSSLFDPQPAAEIAMAPRPEPPELEEEPEEDGEDCGDDCDMEDERGEEEPEGEAEGLFGDVSLTREDREAARAAQRDAYEAGRRASIMAHTEDPDPEILARMVDAIRCTLDHYEGDGPHSISEFSIDICRGPVCDDEAVRMPVMAHLLRLGALEFGPGNNYTVHLDKLPPEEPRDLWADIMDYLAHELIRDEFSGADLKYKLRAYGDAREAAWERLVREKYVTGDGKLLKRPPGATVAIVHKDVRGGEAGVTVSRGEDGNWMILSQAFVKCKSGWGRYGPVWFGEYGENWPDREGGIRQGWLEVIEHLEQARESARHETPANTAAVRIATDLRLWAEQQLGESVPPILPPGWWDDRTAELNASRAEYNALVAAREVPTQHMNVMLPQEPQGSLF